MRSYFLRLSTSQKIILPVVACAFFFSFCQAIAGLVAFCGYIAQRDAQSDEYRQELDNWGVVGYASGTDRNELEANLKKRPDANHICLYQQGAGDECLEVAGRIHDLRILTALHSAITDAGLAHLADKTELRRLSLYSTSIGDSGVEHLKSLTKLEDLSLINTRVTDEGLIHLKKLTKFI